VQFNHYGGEAARLAAALVNAGPADALAPLLRAHGIHRPPPTPRGEGELREWARDVLAPCFAPSGGRPLAPDALTERCERANSALALAASLPRISLHDGTPHLHYGPEDQETVGHVKASTAAGLAYVICTSSAHRLGRCARCDGAYVDTSRAGRRTYCTVRCANNDAVARHRTRR
jgi:predicted RNA-binding Zn ribbon-like protein